jgi:hypothetical protein
MGEAELQDEAAAVRGVDVADRGPSAEYLDLLASGFGVLSRSVKARIRDEVAGGVENLPVLR